MGRPSADRTGRKSYYTYRLVSGLLSIVPRSLALATGAAFGRLAARRRPEQRAVVASNLAHVLGGTDQSQLDRLVRASFSSYGRYWADSAKLGPRDARHVARRFIVTGGEHVAAAKAAGGIIFALPHLGSWEMGGIWAVQQGLPLLTVAEDAASPELFEWFVKRRERLGMRILPITAQTPTLLLTELRGGGAIALVADRDVVGDGIDVNFFGARAQVPAGPAVLALRSGAALVPSVVYQDGNRYRAVFGAPINTERSAGRLRDDVRRVTDDLVRIFEEYIAVAPEQWHLFQPNWSEPDQLAQSVRAGQ